MSRPWFLVLSLALAVALPLEAQTRLLRQPSVSAREIVFTYGSDVWIVERAGGTARRLTSTPAVESAPSFSPDGQWVAFTSNRSGVQQVYVVSREGGDPQRLTWYPSPSVVRGWTADGSAVLYASGREAAPTNFMRLWTVPRAGGPSTRLPAPWGFNGALSADGRQLVVDRMTRWDGEWRNYRGGQNTALSVLNLASLEEVKLPNDARTTDVNPVWSGNKIYFLSDRDYAMNVWSYDPSSRAVAQVTRSRDGDIKWLSAGPDRLAYELDGYVFLLDPTSGQSERVNITVRGDFPWMATRWEDVSTQVTAATLGQTGQRILVEARGDVWTVPVEHGDARNLSRSSGSADRAAVASPDGKQVAWVSSDGGDYAMFIANADGTGAPRRVSIAPSKMAWSPSWSPDGSRIAFIDDDARIRVLEVASGNARTADVNGNVIDNLFFDAVQLRWSPDSKFLAYAKIFPNQFHRIVVWSVERNEARPVTDALADAINPAWDRDGRHLYFLASTNLALGAGWLNMTSALASPTYAPYVMVLRNDDPTPFGPRSDEEPAPRPPRPDTAAVSVRVDFDGIERRILNLPMPVRSYGAVQAGPRGSVFIAENVPNETGVVLHKFVLVEREAKVFVRGVNLVSVSGDGSKILLRTGNNWRVVPTAAPPTAAPATGPAARVNVALRMELSRTDEWRQMFDESWRFSKEFFYDPGMHGNDWNAVRERYRPLVEHVRHRSDLNYLLDMVNGELSVGHSFVGGGVMPGVDTSRVGLLGADLVADGGRWRIRRIYTMESWNPGMSAPLSQPGLRVKEGDYILAVNGEELTASDDPFRVFDGTQGRQTIVQFNSRPNATGAWTETIVPIQNESALRTRAWVEDNRRKVDSLSGGRVAYIWVPNTGDGGFTSFNRYFFAQQDKQGAIVDERFNGGGTADDYMVDLAARTRRGAFTNEAEGGRPTALPQGITGPKVMLINELAGSGGDYFPWSFRLLEVGPLIGMRTWGGLVANASPYLLIDGGRVTTPFPALFDPATNKWIAENEGVPPDIEVYNDAKAVAEGRDPQLERAVAETLRRIQEANVRPLQPPPFPRPYRRPGGN